jgi:hypothetical protein
MGKLMMSSSLEQVCLLFMTFSWAFEACVEGGVVAALAMHGSVKV